MIDLKILAYAIKGPVEYNHIQRCIDGSILIDAILLEYKSIATKIKGYHSSYRTPPSLDILREITDSLDELQVCEELSEISISSTEIEYYIDKLKDRYNLYLLNKLASVADENLSLRDSNDILQKTVAKITRLEKKSVFSEGNIGDETEDIEGEYKNLEESPEQIDGVFLGYKELDAYTWGLKKSEMLVIVGATSSGKSLLMQNIGVNAWLGSNNPLAEEDEEIKDDGKNVVYVSLEMSKSQLRNRIIASIADINLTSISRGLMTDSEKERFKRAISFLKRYKKKFYIIDMPRGTKIFELEDKYDSIRAEFEPDLVCIDYLQLMKASNPSQQDWLGVGTVAEEVHEFCRKKNIPTITAAQRKAKDKKAKSDVQDAEEIGRSKMIGDNASVVFLIENRDEEHLKEDMIVHIVKNRNGAKGQVSLLKAFDKAKIMSLPDDWVSDTGEENEV